MPTSYTGQCFCGAVEIRVTGEPEVMGYCHCRSCRSWSGGPVNAFTLWPPEAVEVVKVRSTSPPSRRPRSRSASIAASAAATSWRRTPP
jgi:hypothetical protein